MKVKVGKFLASLFLSCLLVGSITITASESDFIEIPQRKVEVIQNNTDSVELMSNPTLSGCTLGIGVASNGVSVSFVTRASEAADEIGVKNVVLQEKTWYGWKDIPISNHSINNSDYYAGEVVYTNAVEGKTYRVYCTHYAKYGSTELTLYNESNNFVYN